MTHEQVIEALKIKRECYDFAGLSCNSKESCRYCEVAMDIAIETLEKYRWIPCSERLPELGKYVLCMCRGNIQEVMRLTPDGWFHDHNHCYMGGFVIVWMPLPEPYKEGAET